MQNAALAHQAYNDAATPVRDDRSAEYQAFARVTRALQVAKDAGSSDMVKLAEAVFLNRRLWGILGGDVSADDNGLPDALKAQILSLSIFVQKHSSAVLNGSGDVEALIEINMNVMRGLQMAPGAGR